MCAKSNFLHISPKNRRFLIFYWTFTDNFGKINTFSRSFHHRKTVSEHHSARFAPLPQAGCFLKNQRNNPPKHRQL
ncbi:hypothetical protein NX88_01845 [Neisseria meningitidis]|nr:hypothetical protein NX88_01845 [Neisseria meningitidis]